MSSILFRAFSRRKKQVTKEILVCKPIVAEIAQTIEEILFLDPVAPWCIYLFDLVLLFGSLALCAFVVKMIWKYVVWLSCLFFLRHRLVEEFFVNY